MLGGPVSADVQFVVSKTDDSYGFCAGCGADGAVRATESCIDGGGSDCRPVLGCGPGWAAVASGWIGDDLGATGITCGLNTEFDASLIAWTFCTDAFNRSCAPGWVITPSNEAREAIVGDLYDIFITQGMLLVMGYDAGRPDGVLGPATLAALNSFQRDMGLTETQTVTRDVAWSVEMAFGGSQRLRDVLREAYVAPYAEKIGDYVFVNASAPQARESFGDQVARYDDEDRRLALTLYLRAQGHPCSDIATQAVNPFTGDNTYWNVNCAEADYDLFLMGDGSTVINATPK